VGIGNAHKYMGCTLHNDSEQRPVVELLENKGMQGEPALDCVNNSGLEQEE